MNSQDKVDKLIAELGEQGHSEYTVAPPLFRMLWKLGIAIPPPLFMSFWSILGLMGFVFAIGFGVFVALLLTTIWFMGFENVPIMQPLVATLCAGLLFGAAMAVYFRYQARKLHLPSWDQYPPD